MRKKPCNCSWDIGIRDRKVYCTCASQPCRLSYLQTPRRQTWGGRGEGGGVLWLLRLFFSHQRPMVIRNIYYFLRDVHLFDMYCPWKNAFFDILNSDIPFSTILGEGNPSYPLRSSTPNLRKNYRFYQWVQRSFSHSVIFLPLHFVTKHSSFLIPKNARFSTSLLHQS